MHYTIAHQLYNQVRVKKDIEKLKKYLRKADFLKQETRVISLDFYSQFNHKYPISGTIIPGTA
jgi:hypothetical protein